MADYRYNFDRRDRGYGCGASMNQIIDVIFGEESSGDTQPLIALSEVKNFCKIDVSEDDALLLEIQLAAIEIIQDKCNIGLRQQATTAILNNGNGGAFLPYGPVGDIVSVSVNDDQTPTDQYRVEGLRWKQILEPRANRITIQYIGGYDVLPYKLKLALLQCIYYLYDERKRPDSAYPAIYMETIKPFSRQ